MRQIAIDIDVHRAIEAARTSFDQSENDILRLLLCKSLSGHKSRSRRHGRTASSAGPDQIVRSRGLWAVDFKGDRTPAANMKDAYRIFLIRIEESVPGFLDRFAAERGKSRRSRRFVARKPEDLFPASPHLARQFAPHLKDGWYFDCNLSADQVASRVRIAARIAGLHYGSDIRILDNLKCL